MSCSDLDTVIGTLKEQTRVLENMKATSDFRNYVEAALNSTVASPEILNILHIEKVFTELNLRNVKEGTLTLLVNQTVMWKLEAVAMHESGYYRINGMLYDGRHNVAEYLDSHQIKAITLTFSDWADQMNDELFHPKRWSRQPDPVRLPDE